MIEPLALLIPLFFLTAVLYSSAGFGGGSTYIALLLLFAVPYPLVPKLALLCNLCVVSGACLYYFRSGLYRNSRILPFIVASIPFAYLGGRLPIGRELFTILLGLSLAAAGIRIFIQTRAYQSKNQPRGPHDWLIGLPIGAVMGLLAGLVGIGGGIFLAPILFSLRWAHAKEAAAAASLFIFVNSIAGLIGQFSKDPVGIDLLAVIPIMLAVVIGGHLGNRIGFQLISKLQLQRITAGLILFVSARLIGSLL